MTAQLHRLPAREHAALRCPECGGQVPAVGGPEYATPLGIRRYRRCAACGERVLTLELVTGWRHPVALAVPADTPGWAVRLAEAVARLGARIGGGR